MTEVSRKLSELTPEQRKLLALRLRQQKAREAAPAPEEREGGVFPLSFAQQRLWVLDRLEPGATGYNMAFAWRLRGALEPGALERALAELVRRHETLRTRIGVRDGEPVQVVEPFGRWTLPVADSPIPEPDREVAFGDRATEEANRPFDLGAGPLFRASLVRAAEDDHLLTWTMHHVVSDGWSTGVFIRELTALYEAFAAGRPSPLAPLPVQYGDVAVRQRERLSGEALDREVAWWKERLDGAPALLELPTDRPRPAVRTDHGATLAFELGGDVAPRVAALARSEDATPFMVLLAAWQALLARWSGADDVVVGTPIANRTTPDVEGLIGYFANTLVLRGDLSGAPTFRELLARVRETTLGAYEHQDLPFEKLVEELNPERSLSHTPLFQVAFVLQNLAAANPAAVGPQRLGGAIVEPVGRARDSARFDLLLTVMQEAGRTTGSIEYAADLWSAATVRRMLAHFATLLDGALASPETRIGDLPLMGAEEDAELRRLAAGPVAARQPSATLPGLFAAQVALTPAAIAVSFGEERLTYAELGARSTALARSLRARGIGAEAPVAVFMERSVEMVVALYGILAAGAFYVPVDPEYPAGRIAYMLEDSGARLVLTQQRLLGQLPGRVDAMALDEPNAWDDTDDGPVEWEIDPDSLAYVIYTSGSTGRPKGAANAHRGVVNRILWMQETFGLAADDVVLQKTPVSFDVSVWELFWPLVAGARLAIAAPGAHREPARLSGEIVRAGATVAHFVPSMLQAWLDDGGVGACATLRRVMSSGEALPAALRDRFFARLPAVELHNLYGPTEAAVDVTWHACTPGDASPVVPIGRPVANTAIHVLDPGGRPCPVGVPGELFIGGVQVGRGYWRRPSLTAGRFVPDPVSAEAGARLYRTGDRARWTAAGTVEYLGRLDFQVKIRGLRIELGEIEAALAAHPAVREAVVTAGPGRGGDPRLVAYLVAADGGEISTDEVEEAVRRTLPGHMVPGAWVVLTALPLTPSGKVDRRALPEPGEPAAAHVPPRTPTEVALAEIWAELLGVERVGAEDGFFALGGHSLLGARLLTRVREAFGVELPLRAVFESPRLSALAAEIDRLAGSGAAAAAPPIVPVERAGDLPASFAQERMWRMQVAQPESTAYAIGSVFHLAGALEVHALERALGEIVRRHEALRTVLPAVDGAPVQRVLPPAFHLPQHDLSTLGEEDRRRAAEQRMRELFATPFRVEREPMFRAALVRLDADEHWFGFSMHHVVSDGWSLGVFFSELSALYTAFVGGRASPLPGLPVQYADYAAWQRGWLAGSVLERQLAYWRGQLAGAPPLLRLPPDRSRTDEQSFRGADLYLLLPAAEHRALQSLAREEGATLFMVLLAAFAGVLARHAGQREVVVGTPIAARPPGTEGLIGLFINYLALRVGVEPGGDFRARLRAVRQTTLGAYAHQDVPFARVVDELGVERIPGATPVFQVLLNVMSYDEGEVAFPGLRVEPRGHAGDQTSKFDLTLYVSEHPDGLLLRLVHSTDLFDTGRMEALLADIHAALAEAAGQPEG